MEGNDDAHRDPKESIFPLVWLIVSWLLAVTNSVTFHVFISTDSREFVLVRGYNSMHKTIVSESMSPAAAIPLALDHCKLVLQICSTRTTCVYTCLPVCYVLTCKLTSIKKVLRCFSIGGDTSA